MATGRPPGNHESPLAIRLRLARGTLFLLLLAFTLHAASFHFAILGDRTGEAQPGVFEQIAAQTAADKPAFILTTGDTIQGGSDATAAQEWQQAEALLKPLRALGLYLVPGNHDIWSPASERLFLQHEKRGLHYSFDHDSAHFTILDNSRSDELPASELAFLEADLKAHAAQPVKFVISHRPSWIVNVALGNPDFPLHRLARKYGVQYVVAGHIHQMLHLELDGVTYLSMPSSGGHLRLSKAYESGWFFGYASVHVSDASVEVRIRETGPPHGEGRTSRLADWGAAGLSRR
jgi:Icc protein